MRKFLILFLLIIPLAIQAQTVNVTGQTYSSTDPNITFLYNVWDHISGATIFTFTNNLLSSLNGSGYMLNAGMETPSQSSYFNWLDGEVISGNKVMWNGTVTDDYGATTHGLFTGNNKNAVIKWNYINNLPSAVQMKSSTSPSMINTTGGISYNIFNNIGLVAIPIKGMQSCKIYNNTFRSTQASVWRGLIDIYSNTDDNADPSYCVSSGTKIKNNIFYTTHQIYNISVYEPQDLVNFESDYNVFYCEAGTPIFGYLGTTKTFAQWQALGYDKNSVVLNPNFTNTTDLVPSVRLNYGTNLGSSFDTGLSTTATWTVNTTPALTTQNGTWQVGARVFAATGVTTPSVTTNAVTVISTTTATCGGTVTSDGGATVIYRGVCWSTSSGPTSANSHTTDGTGTGSFTSSITGLTNNTTYYVRAYATNSAGTSYGAETSFTTTSSSGNTYYVSTTGSDSNPGTISAPWLTWQYGFSHISTGDILYIRGGTYTVSSFNTSIFGIALTAKTGVSFSARNGSSSSYYQVYNYPGETPILNCINATGSYEFYGVYLYQCNYWHLKGLTFINNVQTNSINGGSGILLYHSNHILIENCNAYNNGGPGFITRMVDQVTFLNCDSHDNYDPYTSDGDGQNADGFDIGFQQGGTIYMTGCRAWNNSDDGFDTYQDDTYSTGGIYYFDHCWAWHQGYESNQVTTGGDGNGFKLGLDHHTSANVQRYLYNCVSYNNRQVGFSQQSGDVKMIFYNNIAYHNGIQGFEFNYYNLADILRNNTSYANGSTDVFQSNQTRTNNSWQIKTVTDADFASVNSSTLTGSRLSNGNLPLISFLHLASSSTLVGAGYNTGQTYDGDGISWSGTYDVGPWKYGSKGAVSVTGITVTAVGGVATITVNGGTLQMNAAITPSDATDQTVSWSVINGTGTGTINSSGVLQASTNGTVTVRATANDGSGIYGDKVITISNQTTIILAIDLHIAGTGGATTISVNGGTLQMVVTDVEPSNATNQTVTWSVVNGTGTASISNTGLLTSSGNGTVTVWARANDGNGAYDFKQITISNQSSGVVLALDLHIAGAGGATTITTKSGTLQMSVTDWHPANTTDQTVTWSVENQTGTASISSVGLLTALTDGTVKVWAHANDGNGAYDFKVITISNQVTLTLPSITTTYASQITTNGALFGGNVISNGGDANAVAGVCWNTSGNPTISNYTGKTISYTITQQTNPFTTSVSGLLTDATKYYYTAYITNSVGTTYGNTYLFTTASLSTSHYVNYNSKHLKDHKAFAKSNY